MIETQYWIIMAIETPWWRMANWRWRSRLHVEVCLILSGRHPVKCVVLPHHKEGNNTDDEATYGVVVPTVRHWYIVERDLRSMRIHLLLKSAWLGIILLDNRAARAFAPSNNNNIHKRTTATTRIPPLYMSSTNAPKKGKNSIVEKAVELPYDASKIRWVLSMMSLSIWKLLPNSSLLTHFQFIQNQQQLFHYSTYWSRQVDAGRSLVGNNPDSGYSWHGSTIVGQYGLGARTRHYH